MKRHFCLAAIVAFIASQVAFAESAAPAPPDRARIVSAARDVIKLVTYATFVTIGADGHADARVVMPAQPDWKLDVWMVTLASSRKVAELKKDPRATFVYFDPATMSYVTLLGSTTIVTDAAEKQKHWQAMWDPYFTKGASSPDVVLVRFVPYRVEVVSPPHKMFADPFGMGVVDIE